MAPSSVNDCKFITDFLVLNIGFNTAICKMRDAYFATEWTLKVYSLEMFEILDFVIDDFEETVYGKLSIQCFLFNEMTKLETAPRLFPIKEFTRKTFK